MRLYFADLGVGLRKLHPQHFPYPRFLSALAVGALGGYGFFKAGIPLPWMLGPMTLLTIASILRAPFAAPSVVRAPMTAIIGVMLGSNFQPAIFGQLIGWLPTLAGLVLFMVTSGFFSVLYFRKAAKFDPITAYFAGMPGGLVEMVLAGDEKGGDARTIALVHSARVLLIVFTVPFLVRWLEGVPMGARAVTGVSVFEVGAVSDLLVFVVAFVGSMLGHVLRFPSKNLIGPMFLSAVLHIGGVTDFVPPREIVSVAQVVLGTVIGCRFAGVAPATILRILGLSLGSTLILLTVTAVFALLVSRISDYGAVPLLLAYSPGGLAEMSLVALSIHAEVAFVAAHHIIRILLVMVSAAPIFTLLGITARREPAGQPEAAE